MLSHCQVFLRSFIRLRRDSRGWAIVLVIVLGILCGCRPTTPPTPPPVSQTANAAAIPSTEAAPVAVQHVKSADGLDIAYEISGEGPVTLLFIHGWCCDRSYWAPQWEHFRKSYRVVAVDLAGHGESALGREQWTMAAFGDDVAAVLDALPGGPVVLIGHSMGGPVMLQAYRKAPVPECILGLVGVDTLQDAHEEFSIEQVAEIVKPYQGDFAAALRGALLHGEDFFKTGVDEKLRDKIVDDMTQAPVEPGRGCLQGMLDYSNDQLRPDLQAVRVPLVCINTSCDPAVVERNQKIVPTYECRTLPDVKVGHFLMMEQPAAFNSLLEEVLQKLPLEKGEGPQSVDSLAPTKTP